MDRRDIELLLDEPDDFKLCNGVVLRFSELRNNEINASGMPEHERVVSLVWHSYGIIGNGGFQYLFEATYPGDPHFEYVAAAYRTIGCAQASRAFDGALAIFPESRPPLNIHARLERYQALDEKDRERIDGEFFADDSRAVEKCLAAYIRANRNTVQHLLSGEVYGSEGVA